MSINSLLCEIPISPSDPRPYGGINIFSPTVRQQSNELFELCKKYGNIYPNSSVLDYGCGTGRLLAKFSNYTKSIIGFDICDRFLTYCRQYNFRVLSKDIIHPEFNPNGKETSQELPCGNAIFDRVIGIALLNHQDITNAKAIISEALRVTKKSGIVIFTAFLINPQSKSQLSFDQTNIKFVEHTSEWWVSNPSRPYLNCAFDESIIRRTIIEAGGQIVEPIHYGQWRNLLNSPTGHDLIVIRKL